MIKYLTISIIVFLPLIVFSYTISGNTLVSTKEILSFLSSNPVKNIKYLYLKHGYPYVDVNIDGNFIYIVEKPLKEIDSDDVIKSSIISILGKFPKFITLSDVQNLSVFLYSLKIPFSIFSKNNYLVVKTNRHIDKIYFNDFVIHTKNLYIFLNQYKPNNNDCKILYTYKWVGSNLMITSSIKLVKVFFNKNFLKYYEIKDCTKVLKREENIFLRNGWDYSLSDDEMKVYEHFVDFDFSSVSIYLKYVYFKIFLNYFDFSHFIQYKIGFIFPYIGVSFDSNENLGFYLNDYNNIFCGFFGGDFAFFMNFDNITFGYYNCFVVGFRYKSQSYMLGYNPLNNSFNLRIFDWRQ